MLGCFLISFYLFVSFSVFVLNLFIETLSFILSTLYIVVFMSFVVYFDQQMGAPHANRWSKWFC